jgi:hypothetical protein
MSHEFSNENNAAVVMDYCDQAERATSDIEHDHVVSAWKVIWSAERKVLLTSRTASNHTADPAAPQRIK